MERTFTAVMGGAEPLQGDGPGTKRSAPLLESLIKRAFDMSAASVALLLLLPFCLTLILLMLVLQGRPILIKQKRVGRRGMMFGCLKFRTMVVNADEMLSAHLKTDPLARAEWETTRKLKVDPRVTPLGQVLRKLSVDELPQFINVLRGEMSLVGPRPIVLDEIAHYGTRIDLYHSVRPGLTGSWQVAGRNNLSYSLRVEMDSHYVENWSLGRDLAILIKTVPAVLTAKGCY